MIRNRHPAGPRRAGFTLIEILLVMGIIVVVLSIGIPSMFRALEKGPIRQAVSDVIEGCRLARAQAIFSGAPADFVLEAESGRMSVRPLRGAAPSSAPGRFEDPDAPEGGASRKNEFAFGAQLHPDVAVELVYLNMEDQMDRPEIRVRFFPNGMSDELDLVLTWFEEKPRHIKVDPMTGLAEAEMVGR